MATTGTATRWALKGTVLGACNCENGCPCNFNAYPSHGHCEGGWTWCVESGSFGDVSLDGLYFTVYGDWPGAIHEGNGRAAAWYDERADEDQRRALETLIAGEAGGPWGIFSNTYEFAGPPQPASYEVELNGQNSRMRIGDAVELEVGPLTNPVTGAELHPRVVLPEGLVVSELDVLVSRKFRVEDGVSYDHSGKYVLLGPFDYKG